MDKSNKKILNLSIRYIILFLLAIPNLFLFYFIFTPLTIYPLYLLLSLFYQTTLSGSTIILGGCSTIEIIKSCVIGSAYYLLLILNLSTPNIKFKKRIKMIVYSFLALLVINILRIFLLSIMYSSGFSAFEVTHKFLWYFASILFVAFIWFYQVKKYKIKEIPIYSDIKFLLKHTKKSNKSKRRK